MFDDLSFCCEKNRQDTSYWFIAMFLARVQVPVGVADICFDGFGYHVILRGYPASRLNARSSRDLRVLAAPRPATPPCSSPPCCARSCSRCSCCRASRRGCGVAPSPEPSCTDTRRECMRSKL
eukprot:2906277-Pleurochrysis_carterae.AAC.1